MDPAPKIFKIILTLIAIIVLGTTGMLYIWPLEPTARFFTIFLIIAGLGAAAYGFSSIVTLFLEGKLMKYLKGAYL